MKLMRMTRQSVRTILAACVAVAFCLAGPLQAAQEKPGAKKIVLIAGKKSHGAGAHEYEKDVKLLTQCLDSSSNVKGIKTEAHFNGWPPDPATLDDADTIVLLSDGLDKQYKLEQHPFLKDDHLAVIEKQVKRGCGLVLIHWPLWVPGEVGNGKFVPWIGGFCDYQNPPAPGMSDAVDWSSQAPHAVCRGLKPFTFNDEYYGNVRFQAKDPRFTPILPFPGKAKAPLWAWAWQRDNGGRSFTFIGGHSHANWKIDMLRKAVLNGIVWSAKVEVPTEGVDSVLPALTDQPKPVAQAGPPIKAVMITGHHHPGHPWKESTPVILDVLKPDARFQVDVKDDPEFLAKGELAGYQLVIMNYCNWERPGLSEAARANFAKFVTNGGGLAVLHFANGAWGPGGHGTTPESVWPEYAGKLCRRVWIDGKSGHDAFGNFRVEITPVLHPITEGVKPFETTDELYYSQQGELPVEPLAVARSKVTKKDEPMAFAYDYGKGRVFQTLLGHAPVSIRAAGELTRRGCVWAAGREQIVAAAAPAAPPREGKFGRALDGRLECASAKSNDAYVTPPITVECWTRLSSKSGFNILVANEDKSSSTHWEMYSFVGSGCFSAYLPGCSPNGIVSKKDIADGQWHYVTMHLDADTVRLCVDGAEVGQTKFVRNEKGTPRKGPLTFGLATQGGSRILCDGLVDEVRISKGLRKIDRVPAAPMAADEQTVGLWHFDDHPDALEFKDASALKAAADKELR